MNWGVQPPPPTIPTMPVRIMDTLLRVQNAAARLVTNTHKYGRGLSTLIHDQLHWLNVPERVEYKLAVMVRQCLENKARTSTKFAASYTSCQLLHCSHRRRTVDIDDQPTCTT